MQSEFIPQFPIVELDQVLRAIRTPLFTPVLRRSPATRRCGAPGVAGPVVRLTDELDARWIGPAASAERGTTLCLHGGDSDFCFHLPTAYRAFCPDVARRTGLPVLLPDYRLAPEHPAPAALDHDKLAYRYLLRSVPPGRLAVVGDSAGGNLALVLLQCCQRLGLPMPSSAAPLSPATDFSGKAWSVHFNEKRDVMFSHARGSRPSAPQPVARPPVVRCASARSRRQRELANGRGHRLPSRLVKDSGSNALQVVSVRFQVPELLE